jgi:hypothetical protein
MVGNHEECPGRNVDSCALTPTHPWSVMGDGHPPPNPGNKIERDAHRSGSAVPENQFNNDAESESFSILSHTPSFPLKELGDDVFFDNRSNRID